MNKKECLTITTSYRAHKKTAIETTTYELLCTSESGDTRIIDIIEVEKIGMKKPKYRPPTQAHGLTGRELLE